MFSPKCVRCGAALPPAFFNSQRRCRECGLVQTHETRHDGRQVAVVPVKPGLGCGCGSLGCLAMIGAPCIACGLLGALINLFSPSTLPYDPAQSSTANRTASGDASAGKRPAPLPPRAAAALSNIPAGTFSLTVEPPPGGYDAFDGGARLPWAVAIARAWATDARLTRLELHGVRDDGTVDLTPAEGLSEAVFRFESAERARRLRERPASADGDGLPVLTLRLRHRRAEVSTAALDTPQPAAPPITPEMIERPDPPKPKPGAPLERIEEVPAPDALPLATIIEQLSAKPTRAVHELTEAVLVEGPRDGWIWQLSADDQTLRFRVRARDGRVLPLTPRR